MDLAAIDRRLLSLRLPLKADGYPLGRGIA
jgi:hypothetical protein